MGAVSHLLRKLARVLGSALVGASVAAFLSGSSCVYATHHCDDPDRCDHGGGGASRSSAELPALSLLETGDEAFRIQVARMAVSERDAGRRVEVGRGPALPAFAGADPGAEADLLTFARRVLHANAAVLGWGRPPRPISARAVTGARWILVDIETEDGARALVQLDRSGRVLALERLGRPSR